MHKHRLTLLWIGVVTGFGLSSCIAPIHAPVALQSPLATEQENVIANLQMTIISDYETLSFEEMADLADAIVLGKVTKVSPFQWNQDSGAYWDDAQTGMAAFPLQFIDVDVLETLVDTITLASPIHLAVSSGEVTTDAKGIVLSAEELPFVPGSQVVLFVRATKIAWRGGLHKAVMLMGNPALSYFILQEDGLYHSNLITATFSFDALKARILAERATPPK